MCRTMNYSQNITVTEDQTITVKAEQGRYRMILIPVDPDSTGYRGFYRGTVLPFVNNARIEHLGESENEDRTHEDLLLECNGGRSSAGMSKKQWKAFLMRVQAHCICKLEIGYPF